MDRLRSTMRRLVLDEAAATAIEYGLLAALIGLSLLAALAVLQVELIGLYDYIITMTGEAFDNAEG